MGEEGSLQTAVRGCKGQAETGVLAAQVIVAQSKGYSRLSASPSFLQDSNYASQTSDWVPALIQGT